MNDTYRPEVVARIKNLLSRQSVEGEDRENTAERFVLDKVEKPKTRVSDLLFLRVRAAAQLLGIDFLSEAEENEIMGIIVIRAMIAGMIEDGKIVEVRDPNGEFVFRARLPSDRRKYEPPLIV